MPLTLNQITMKEISQDLIKKNLYWIVSHLIAIIFCFHLTWTLKTFEFLLDTFAPLRKISKNKIKFKDKPWTTPGLQKSIFIKNQFLSKYIKLKDPFKKRNPNKEQTIQKSFIETI